MTYIEFAQQKPILYGQIRVNGRFKIGQFKPEWNHKSNSMNYQYYTHSGNKGTGGFTMVKAYNAFMGNTLSTNPEHGDPDNYVN